MEIFTQVDPSTTTTVIHSLRKLNALDMTCPGDNFVECNSQNSVTKCRLRGVFVAINGHSDSAVMASKLSLIAMKGSLDSARSLGADSDEVSIVGDVNIALCNSRNIAVESVRVGAYFTRMHMISLLDNVHSIASYKHIFNLLSIRSTFISLWMAGDTN